MTDELTLPPPTDEAMARVRGELRSEWWKATMIIGAPAVLGVALTYIATRQVLGGDWFALLFPGVPALVLLVIGLRLLVLGLVVSRRERQMEDAERDRAVYARGLSGTHQLAAAQEPSGYAPLDGLWRPSWAEVVSVDPQRAMSPRVHADVDVRFTDGTERTALLIAPRAAIPEVGDRVVVLMDPHCDRGVVDLRESSRLALRKRGRR